MSKKLTFIDKNGKEQPLLQEKLLSILSPPETIEKAIYLAAITYEPGIFSGFREATLPEIKKFLYTRGLSKEASEYAAQEGFKIYKRKKIE